MKYNPGDARTWARENLKGYICAFYTPFLTSGAIDWNALERNIMSTLELPGVRGLSVNTIHQEFWTFTPRERMMVVDFTLKVLEGRYPVVVGCSDPSARMASEYVAHAEAAGADFVMVWPPFYGPKTSAGVRSYYETVAENVDIGIFVYSTTLSELGYYLDPPQVQQLLTIPNICGVQNTTLNIAQYASMVEAVGDEIPVAPSLEEYFLLGKLIFPDSAPDFMIGSSRPIFCQSSAKPYCGDFISCVENGDYDAAALLLRDILRVAQRLQGQFFAQGFHHVSLLKALLEQLGFDGGTTRPPLGAPPEAEVSECLKILRSEGIIYCNAPID